MADATEGLPALDIEMGEYDDLESEANKKLDPGRIAFVSQVRPRPGAAKNPVSSISRGVCRLWSALIPPTTTSLSSTIRLLRVRVA